MIKIILTAIFSIIATLSAIIFGSRKQKNESISKDIMNDILNKKKKDIDELNKKEKQIEDNINNTIDKSIKEAGKINEGKKDIRKITEDIIKNWK